MTDRGKLDTITLRGSGCVCPYVQRMTKDRHPQPEWRLHYSASCELHYELSGDDPGWLRTFWLFLWSLYH